MEFLNHFKDKAESPLFMETVREMDSFPGFYSEKGVVMALINRILEGSSFEYKTLVFSRSSIEFNAIVKKLFHSLGLDIEIL